jgi:hypothetical protein
VNLFQPIQELVNLGALAVRGHSRLEAAKDVAKGRARPGNPMIGFQHLKHLLLRMLGRPAAHALGQGRRCQADFDA